MRLNRFPGRSGCGRCHLSSTCTPELPLTLPVSLAENRRRTRCSCGVLYDTDRREGERRRVVDSKNKRMREVVRQRQANTWDGYHALGEFHSGAYECDHVSPYTKGACDLNASVFILLQDWSSAETLRGPFRQDVADLGRDEKLFGTNRRLRELLKDHLGLELADTYATNLFPFIKPGDASAAIPMKVLNRAAREFAVPQIQIVEPTLVVCLSFVTFKALQSVVPMRRARSGAAAIETPFRAWGAEVWCQAHPGARGQSNRGRDQVRRDWARMASAHRVSDGSGARMGGP